VTTPVLYRQPLEHELERTYEIFLEASSDLNRQHGRASSPESGTPRLRALAFRRNALRHDPERFWVAEADGLLVGFGAAVQRDRVWHLAALHVVPAFQALGVGSELLRRCLEASPPGTLYTVVSDSVNPVSNAMYAKRGMLPQVALLHLEGPTEPVTRATPPASVTFEPFPPGGAHPALLGVIDVAVLGCSRPQDHVLWASVPDLAGFYVRSGASVAGYMYVAGTGALGPCAVLRSEDFAPAIGLAIEAARAMGSATAKVRMSSAARPAIADLLGRGFRYGPAIGLLLTSETWGQMDRYVSSGGDALF